jgi:uncharacterized protein YneF (UPF0154 family)
MDIGSIFAIIMGILVPIAGFLGFYVTKKLIEKQLRENPPISENQIRTMFMSMGRKPSEAQIRSIMNNIRGANKQGYKKRK